MPVYISNAIFRKIKQHAEGIYPNECCGFLLGRQNGNGKDVADILPVDNESEGGEQYHRFVITPQTYLKGDRQASRRQLDILGFYHSHPDEEARPSQYDLDHAWPWYSYIIASVINKVTNAVTSWVLKEDRSEFLREDIVLDGK